MSGSVAKAERRDLRRSIGAEGIRLVEMHAGILADQVLPGIKAAHAGVGEVRAGLKTATVNIDRNAQAADAELARLDDALDDIDARLYALEAFSRLGFWGRLRWVVTGSQHGQRTGRESHGERDHAEG